MAARGASSVHHDGMIHDVALDYYGRRLATCSSDRRIKIYEVEGETQRLVETLKGHESAVWSVSWAHPKYGSILASSSFDGKVFIWREQAGSWQRLFDFALHKASVNLVAWSPHEAGCLLACASSDGAVSVLEFKDNSFEHTTFPAHGLGVNGVSWAPATSAGSLISSSPSPAAAGNRRFVTGGSDNVLRVWAWDPATAAYVAEGEPLAGHTDWVRDVAWSPTVLQKSYIASASQDRTVRIWTADAHAPGAHGGWTSKELVFDVPVWRVNWSLSGNVLAVSSTTSATHTMKTVLSVNAGSSSVKISVFTVAALGALPHQVAEAEVNGLTAPPPLVDYQRGGTVVYKGETAGNIKFPGAEEMAQKPINSQDDAFSLLLQLFVSDAELTEIGSLDDIAIVTHRIVHGGDYTAPQIVAGGTYTALEKLNDLAPLHNAKSLEIVRSCLRKLPGATNIACFDSQFHATLPPHISTYPINPAIAKSNMLRKYGFHGLSYAFITRSVAAFLGKPASQTSIIALHLGSGASACAIKQGQSWDTSMGLTPLAGLPGATRSGSVDPSLVFHYASDVGRLSPASTRDLHISRAEEILNKESGWKALTGTTNFGDIAASDKPSHQLAFDLFVDRVCGFVGSYYVTLRGQVDAVVFAGGIGERSDRLRAAVIDQCSCLGFAIDAAANRARLTDTVSDITAKGARHRVLVCRTDEQLEMAREGSENENLWKGITKPTPTA